MSLNLSTSKLKRKLRLPHRPGLSNRQPEPLRIIEREAGQ
jgi:hypothetical protein